MVRLLALAFGLAILAIAAACGGDGEPEVVPTSTAPSIATSAPSTASPTRAPTGPPAVTFVDAFPQLPRLERPTAMLELPGQGYMLLALQDGRLFVFPNDASASQFATALDLRDTVSRGGNEEGFLGLALDPAFGDNGYLYAYYNVKPGERRTRLSRFETSGQGASFRINSGSELVILEVPQPYSNHNGGQVAFGPDGMLYLGLGDGGSGGDPHGNGQDVRNNLLGSILRIDVRNARNGQTYVIPPDNPFANTNDGARRETWAYGLRNPWRFSFDRETGQLWAGDVGQGQREEVDLIEKGGNYGWNLMEGMACYRPSTGCNTSGLILPVVDYTHAGGGCSVVGGYVYRGEAVPNLFGWYIYADYCSGGVWAFEAANATPGRPPEVTTFREDGANIASFAEDIAGELYALAFDGNIYRIITAN